MLSYIIAAGYSLISCINMMKMTSDRNNTWFSLSLIFWKQIFFVFFHAFHVFESQGLLAVTEDQKRNEAIGRHGEMNRDQDPNLFGASKMNKFWWDLENLLLGFTKIFRFANRCFSIQKSVLVRNPISQIPNVTFGALANLNLEQTTRNETSDFNNNFEQRNGILR